ncbi:GmrSD restriction endonuclease domain-containing protein [Vibrio antiquarius]
MLNIRTENFQMSLGEVINLLNDAEIAIPEHARYGEDWNLEQKKAYIESMLLGFPVSSFIVVKSDEGIWKVVDGVKRFKALIGFLSDDFKVIPHTPYEEVIGKEEYYSQLKSELLRHIKRMSLHFFVHSFSNDEDAKKFEKRLHADFEFLTRKVVVIDRSLSFDSDTYLEALTLIASFNSHLLQKYPEKNISVKVQQEGKSIRLIVETENSSHIETEQILDDFNKSMLRKIHQMQGNQEKFMHNGGSIISNLHVNLKNENNIDAKVNVDVNINLKNIVERNNCLISELIEEASSEPELVNQLREIISSSESVSSPRQLENSSFINRVSRLMEQAHKKGTAMYDLAKKSKECADLISKIIDNFQAINGFL